MARKEILLGSYLINEDSFPYTIAEIGINHNGDLQIAQKLIDAVNVRINLASDKFQTDLSRARGQEGAVVQAILALRKEMVFLAQAINLPAIPEDERKCYLGLVMEQADAMQKSLEDSAKNDRSGKFSSIVRNHKVNAF